MEKYKILKVYFIIFLVLGYGVFAFFDEFVIFFSSTLMFNLAISLMFITGLIVLFSGVTKLILFEVNLEMLEKNISNLKDKDLELAQLIYPSNILNIFRDKVNKEKVFFKDEERDDIIDYLNEYFGEKQTYIDFFVGTALMLGLLGTFMGLLIAIDEMSGIIDLLVNMETLDLKKVIASFGGPLGGMSTGFGSSLFGVIVAILLNLLYYLFSKAKTKYINKQLIFLNNNLVDEHILNQISEQIKIGSNQEELLKGIHSLIQIHTEKLKDKE